MLQKGLLKLTISGTVTDDSGELVIGAYVSIGNETVATNFEGAYSITLLAGEHLLKCSFYWNSTAEKLSNLRDGDHAV